MSIIYRSVKGSKLTSDEVDGNFQFLDDNSNLKLTSPLNTKGDILFYSTTNSRFPVGVDGQVLLADSSLPEGLRWGNVAGGSGGTESGTSLRMGTGTAFGSGTTGNTILGQSSTGGIQLSTIVGYNNKAGNGASANFLIGANITANGGSYSNTIAIGDNITVTQGNKVILSTSASATTFDGLGYVGIGNSLSVTNTTNALNGIVQVGFQSSALDSTINSVVIGSSARSYIDATYGTANGENVAIGYKADAGSWKGIAIGGYAKALSVSSSAIGHTTYAIAAHCHVFGRGGYSDKGNSVLLYNGSASATLYLGTIYASHTNPSITGSETIDNSASLNAGTNIYAIKTTSGVDAKPTPTLTNVRGAHMALYGGESTGTALGGELRVYTTPAGGVSNNTINTAVECAAFDAAAYVAGTVQTRFMLLDLSTGTLKRVLFGANDSAGAGFKYLKVAN